MNFHKKNITVLTLESKINYLINICGNKCFFMNMLADF